jgi:hypothetical protein
MEKVIVSKSEIIKATEFVCSTAYTGRKESWLFFSNIFVLDFYYEDEKPSHKDLEGYSEWLKYTDSSDNDENYQLWLVSVRDYWEGLLLSEVNDIEIEYID